MFCTRRSWSLRKNKKTKRPLEALSSPTTEKRRATLLRSLPNPSPKRTNRGPRATAAAGEALDRSVTGVGCELESVHAQCTTCQKNLACFRLVYAAGRRPRPCHGHAFQQIASARGQHGTAQHNTTRNSNEGFGHRRKPGHRIRPLSAARSGTQLPRSIVGSFAAKGIGRRFEDRDRYRNDAGMQGIGCLLGTRHVQRRVCGSGRRRGCFGGRSWFWSWFWSCNDHQAGSHCQ
mmetsp:Transcript_2256/g.6046  ORF Transcript_2256/g.6046 Transcript_2256/m.6046 type:complete len:233 (+) Transcript_2256:1172-1870(+)